MGIVQVTVYEIRCNDLLEAEARIELREQLHQATQERDQLVAELEQARAEIERLREGLGRLRDYDPFARFDGHAEVIYGEFAYRGMVETYREAAQKILSEEEHEEGPNP